MLYQPTNITPSTFGEMGNGIVSENGPIPVSWQVNGNSKMTAFQIDIYSNDAASTLLLTTGRLTDGCPFSGKTATGEYQLFSYEIPYSSVSAAGITAGNSYKLTIRQYYISNSYLAEESYVEQRSPSIFSVSAGMVFMPPGIYQDVVTTKSYAFTFDAVPGYPTAPIIPFNWVAYRLAQNASMRYDSTVTNGKIDFSTFGTAVAEASGAYQFTYETGGWSFMGASYASLSDFGITYNGTPTNGDVITVWYGVDTEVYDSGPIYGVTDYTFTYDGFLPNAKYTLTGTGQLQNGANAIPGSVTFTVAYDVPEIDGGCSACKAPDGENAVEVAWPGVIYIGGTASGSYTLSGGSVTLPTSSDSITWDFRNGPWGSSGINEDNKTLNTYISGTIRLAEGASYVATTIKVAYSGAGDLASYELRVTGRGLLLYKMRQSQVWWSRMLYQSSVDTNVTFYISINDNTIGVVGSAENGEPFSSYATESYTIVTIREISICNGTFEYAKVYTNSGTDVETYDAGTLFLATFDTSINGGMLPSTVGNGYYAIYRRSEGDPFLNHIANAGEGKLSVLDYGAVNGGGPYSYAIFYVGGDGSDYVVGVTPPITPRASKWTLLQCEAVEENGDTVGSEKYTVKAAYNFDCNLSSGTIGNNNQPNVQNTFTAYPNVQLATPMYKSGTLQSLAGEANGGTYSDTAALRNALMSLANTSDALFLKSRKGDLLRVRIAGPVSVTIEDGTAEQAQQISVPWVEVGSADAVGITK